MATLVTKEQSARDRMHHIIDIVDEDKVKAMLTLFQGLEEEEGFFEYPDHLKAQLDTDFAAYQSGEKTYSEQEVRTHTDELLKSLGVRK